MHSELVHHSQDTMARQGATFSREEDEELGDQLDMDLPDEEDDFVFELKKLKEGVFPLKLKIRQGNAWPQLREKISKETAVTFKTESNNIKAQLSGVLEGIKHLALWNNKLKTVEVTWQDKGIFYLLI